LRNNSPRHAAPRAELELLAPARDADIGIEAINHGADAVYIGGPAFGARDKAGNSLAEIERLVRHAHRHGVRTKLLQQPVDLAPLRAELRAGSLDGLKRTARV
jgi:putative protease